MSLARRIDALDAALTPTQLVLRWLDEAHAFGDLESYVRSTLDAPADEQPINRLCREASEGARARLRGKPQEQVRAAVNSALRATLFRFELALRIITTAHELLDREALLYALLSSQLALLVSDEREARRRDPTHLRRLRQCRDLTFVRVDELLARQEARANVEARYLDGHPALFPDTLAAFEEQLQRSQELAVLAMRLAELEGVEPALPADPAAGNVRAVDLAADLVQPAKSEALEKLGEGERAFAVAIDWLRPKLDRAPVQVPETLTP